MEETLSNARFISFHRNQINPEPHPKSTLTFAYGDRKYGNYLFFKSLFRKNVQRTGRQRRCAKEESADRN